MKEKINKVTKSKLAINIFFLSVVFGFTVLHESCNQQNKEADINEAKNIGIDKSTGLIIDNGYKVVKQKCLPCHSGKLIIQNRATREGWVNIIRWMQKKQKLEDLGDNEDIILDYLAKNYAPEDKGRRVPLKNIEWYEIKED